MIEQLEEELYLKILKDSIIIGMTTTGAAKFTSLLEKVKNKILIIEEAGKILESHVAISLKDSLEHLILIGDH